MAFPGYFAQRGEEAAAKGRHGRAGKSIDLQHVSEPDLAACAKQLSALAEGASSGEDAARRVVGHLFETFITGENHAPACALVRCFQTHPLSSLPPERKAFALRQLGAVPLRVDMRCLTLLATRGMEPQWNRVEDSTGHQAVPLPSVEVILKTPMIARLLLQMGIRYEHVVAPPEGDDFLIGASADALRVFHVARARGSRYIPAQASFVHRYGIRSVLGLGGVSTSGELTVVVMFTRVQVSRETAELFSTLAGAVRSAMARFPPEHTFDVPVARL